MLGKNSWFASVLILALMTACTPASYNGPGPEPGNNKVVQYDVRTIALASGASVSIGRSDIECHPVCETLAFKSSRTTGIYDVSGKMVCVGDANHKNHAPIVLSLVDAVIDVQDAYRHYSERFPYLEPGLQFSHRDLTDFMSNFMYVSDGKPVTMIPLYSTTKNDDSILLYYYDENGMYHQQRLWHTGDNLWRTGQMADKPYVTINDDRKGISFTLPKGFRYGFACQTGESAYHFSSVDENVIRNIESMLPGPNKVSTVRYYCGNYDIIGFEDTFRSSDNDFNDVVLAVYPSQTPIDFSKVSTVSLDFGSLNKEVSFMFNEADVKIKADNMLKPLSDAKYSFGVLLSPNEVFNVTIKNIDKFSGYWKESSEDSEELVFDIHMAYPKMSRKDVMQLFGLDVGSQVGNDSYDFEGSMSTDFWYKINIGLAEKDVHMTIIVFRRK